MHFEVLQKEGKQDLIEKCVATYEVGKEKCMIEESSVKDSDDSPTIKG